MKFVKVHNPGTKQCGSGLRHAFRAGGSQRLAQHPSAGARSWEAALGSRRTVPEYVMGGDPSGRVRSRYQVACY